MVKTNNQRAKRAAPHENGEDSRLADAIQAWMVVRLSEELKVALADIDVREPLLSYGLDSVVAFSLTGELADWLGRELPVTLFWDFPTIETLAQHLAEKVPGGQSAATLYNRMAGILQEIEGLSEKEAERRLAEKNKP